VPKQPGDDALAAFLTRESFIRSVRFESPARQLQRDDFATLMNFLIPRSTAIG
jgi:hypothetical protein